MIRNFLPESVSFLDGFLNIWCDVNFPFSASRGFSSMFTSCFSRHLFTLRRHVLNKVEGKKTPVVFSGTKAYIYEEVFVIPYK